MAGLKAVPESIPLPSGRVCLGIQLVHDGDLFEMVVRVQKAESPC